MDDNLSEAVIDAGMIRDAEIKLLKDAIELAKEQFKIDWNTTNKRIDVLQRQIEKLMGKKEETRFIQNSLD